MKAKKNPKGGTLNFSKTAGKKVKIDF
jgi:hypothetical protein